MTQGFTIQGDGFIRVQAKLNDLRARIRSSATLNVGWDNRTNYSDGTPVAKVARVQEYGAVISRKGKLLMTTRFVGAGFKGDTFTTAAHEIVIPARPFIRPAIIEHGDEWAKFVFHDIEETDAPLDVILERLGIRIVGDIQNAIRAVQSPRLAASTIRNRLKGGYSDYGTATKPLIDTGLMLRSIRSDVVMGNTASAPSVAPAPAPEPSPIPTPEPPNPTPRKRGILGRVLDWGRRLFGR